MDLLEFIIIILLLLLTAYFFPKSSHCHKFSYLILLSYIFYFSLAYHSFPYIKKRIKTQNIKSFELKPIEVALDEMTNKCNELEEIVLSEPVDLKKLQLRLQGSISVQVTIKAYVSNVWM